MQTATVWKVDGTLESFEKAARTGAPRAGGKTQDSLPVIDAVSVTA